MYLERILGSTTKINALAVLVPNPERSYLENELARISGTSASEVNRQMKDLVNAGIVLMQRVGKAKLYQMNEKHFLFKPLRELFRNLEDVYREAASEVATWLTRRHKPRTIILFGSLSKGRIRSDLVREPSDIDLIIIAEEGDIKNVRADLLNFINTEISLRYGIIVYPIVLSVEEYLSGLARDQFIIDVNARGEILYGEKPRRFG